MGANAITRSKGLLAKGVHVMRAIIYTQTLLEHFCNMFETVITEPSLGNPATIYIYRHQSSLERVNNLLHTCETNTSGTGSHDFHSTR